MIDEPLSIIIEDESGAVSIDPETGAMETRQPDGGVVVNLKDHRKADEEDDKGFFANLVDRIDKGLLTRIAEDLHEGISADDDSRAEYLANRARALELLGTKLAEPKSTVADGSNPVEGMSSVTNPLLLEAVLKGWANSVGEFLPATGPVKIKSDGEETQVEDELAETLERDMN